MENGELGPGGLFYRDDLYKGTGDATRDRAPLTAGLGQLSDGMTGCGDDPAEDCGSGRGFEWVGWRGDSTITFEFGTRCDFTAIRIHSANRPDRGAPLWGSVTVSFSDDGLRFSELVIQEPTPEDRKDRHARYIEIPVNATANIVRIHLTRANPGAWVLISDVVFAGKISVHQADPVRPR